MEINEKERNKWKKLNKKEQIVLFIDTFEQTTNCSLCLLIEFIDNSKLVTDARLFLKRESNTIFIIFP